MAIHKSSDDPSPRFTGAVVRTWTAVYGGSDHDQLFATVWDAETRSFSEVCCGDMSNLAGLEVYVDATAEVLAAWNALQEHLRVSPAPPVVRLGPMAIYRWRESISGPRRTDRFAEAVALASRLHRAQFRKATRLPYVGHLLGVASIVLDYGGSEDEAIAALLHDAVEDQGGEPTSELIRQYFGQEVYIIVKGCTDATVIPKPPWRARKEAYIEHVRQAPHSVKLVSAADKLHNARSILADLELVGAELWERFGGGKDGTLWYYRALVEAFRIGESATSVTRLVDELDRSVREIERRAG